MLSIPKEPPELLAICEHWAVVFEKKREDAARIEFIRGELPALLGNDALFTGILENLVKGGNYPDIRQAQMFEAEMLLHLNRKRLFSIRMFLYGPHDYTPIHDHNSWGVSGSALGDLGVVRYRREDDGSRDGFARLTRTDHLILKPGEPEVTLPLDRGIHQTGNPTGKTIIMISVYGSPIRRLYVNRYHMRANKVDRLYPPRIKKKMLAKQALSSFKAGRAPDKDQSKSFAPGGEDPNT